MHNCHHRGAPPIYRRLRTSQGLLVALSLLLTFSQLAQAQWDFRKKITIDRTNVGASGTSNTTIADFPFLISLTDNDLRTTGNGGGVTDADGDDILFWALDDDTCGGVGLAPCALNHEIEKYVATTGELVAWVRIPSLNTNAATSDTEIYIYYGNSSVTSPLENPEGVWDDDFEAVWHLHDDFEDSTGNNNDGTNNGTSSATGNSADGRDFDGTDDLVTTTSNELETANDFTISLWFNADATDFAHHLVWQGDGSGNGWGDSSNTHQEMHITLGDFPAGNPAGVSSDDLLSFTLGDVDETFDTDVLSLNTSFTDTSNFHHVLITVSNLSTSPSAEMFLDGVSVDTDTGTTTRTSRTNWDTDFQFGRSGAATRYFDGILDEVRISSIVRPDDWVATAFENSDDPAGIVTVGAEEADPPTAVKGLTARVLPLTTGQWICWQSESEVNNLGFHVYRERNQQTLRITPSLIAGSALPTTGSRLLNAGSNYSFIDRQGRPNDRYWIDDLDLRTGMSRHGPFVPDLGTPPLPGAAARTSTFVNQLSTRTASKRTVRSRPPRQQATAAQQSVSWQSVPSLWENPGLSRDQVQQRLAASPAVVLSVSGEPTWTRVGIADLIAAGIEPDVDPRRLQLYCNGREQSIVVVGEADGSFDPGDRIEFLGQGFDDAWNGAQTYWLVQGSRPGLRVQTAASRVTVNTLTARPQFESFSHRVLRKDRLAYFPSLLNGDAENFFGALIAEEPVAQVVSLRHPYLDRSGSALLEVSLQGVTQVGHRVRVEWNGTELGEIEFLGQHQALGRFPISATQLLQGKNVVTLTGEGGTDFSFVDFVAVRYPHAYRASRDSLLCTAVGPGTLMLEGFRAPRIRVLDISNPEHPMRFADAMTMPTQGSYTCTVALPSSTHTTLLAFTETAIAAPDSIATNRPSAWTQSNRRGRIVIITHRDFFASAQRLGNHRRNDGWSVALVNLEDLYDELNYGQRSPQAIRDFLQYAATNWEQPPSFVVLFGDATLDPRGYLGGEQLDFVPTQLVETEYLETASDDWFVDFDDDAFPEIAIGRLPARTTAEAEAMVDKIIDYERGGSLLSRAPRPRVLLVADNNDEVFDFEATMAPLKDLVAPEYEVETFVTRNNSLASQRLLEELSFGPRVVTYAGHGGRGTWSGDLLDLGQIASLQNPESLSFYVAMTCLNGYFHDAFDDSLGEALLRSDGGAIAVWASSGMSRQGGQIDANQALFVGLFGGGGLTLGEAILQAKLAVEDRDVRRSWNLLGDPVLKLRR